MRASLRVAGKIFFGTWTGGRHQNEMSAGGAERIVRFELRSRLRGPRDYVIAQVK
jgi:hypothetical protein